MRSLLGVAYQRGLIPLDATSIQKAIDLNGVAVPLNQMAFQTGRAWVHDRASVERQLKPKKLDQTALSLDELIASRISHLTAYKSKSYAKRYKILIDKIRTVDMGSEQALTRAVAHNLAKLMAYKDEYEVARLFTDGRFEAQVKETFAGDFKLNFHLAPPLLSKFDPATGRPAKRSYGPWMMRSFRLLAGLKSLRGNTV